mgnify:CR=1 FL=1
MTHPKSFNAFALLAASLAANVSIAQESDTVSLETVQVSADFRELDLQQIPSAITVVGSDDIQNRNADHLESILSLAPNVNFSAGASRGRFFQIRGIGERSQFLDSVNHSVGLYVDSIDMTGLGGSAALFDTEQVEILRGPQGTGFGANALAGLINIQSTDASAESGYISAKIGEYNSQNLSAAYGEKLSDNLSARISVQTNTSDGYMGNDYLNKKDTNGFDEKAVKAKLKWENNSSEYNLNLFHINTNNGYDAFTIDNSRTTQSDQPGKDKIEANAFSVQTSNFKSSNYILETSTEYSKANSFYSYDYDWMNIGYRGNTITDYEEFARDTEKGSVDVRLLSKPSLNLFNGTTSWVAGVYNRLFEESLNQERIGDYGNSTFDSSLDYQSTALYAELKTTISPVVSLTYGVRVENWNADFTTSKGFKDDHSEMLYGGKLALDYLLTPNHMTYVSVSRGYKAGGFNSDVNFGTGSALPSDLITYDTEYNWATEIGLKSSTLNDTLTSRIAVFHIVRENQQVKNSTVRDNGATFIDSINNAASGKNYGLEVESSWSVSEAITWNASMGLIETEINGFAVNIDTDGDWVIDSTVDKSGREQSHAPSYTFATSLDIALTNSISTSVEVEGKDEFYFSDSHDAKSESYELIHASITYTQENWSISLIGKNLTDEDVETRGFSGWVQDPMGVYTPDNYVQFGEPRLISIQTRYNF